MSLSALADEELVVFLGLARQLVIADSDYSGDERALLRRYAADLGPRWDLAIADAMNRLDSLEDVWEAARGVRSPEARALILRELRGLAAADGVAETERSLLAELEVAWGER